MTENSRLSEPVLSLAERDRRHAGARDLMRERGLSCLIVPHHTGDWDNYQADTRYLTCVGGGGAATALVFPLSGQPVVAVREARRIGWWAAAQNWVSDVRSPLELRWSQFFLETLRELGITAGRVGVVGMRGVFRDPEGVMPYGEFVPLQKGLPEVAFVDATDLLYRLRKCKSAEELVMMEHAQRCADATSQALREFCRPGITEHALYAELFAAAIRNGGEVPAMILMCAGKQSWQTELLPRFRTLEAGDIVIMDSEPKYCGYMAQAVDTVSLRPLTDLEQELYAVAEECFDLLLSEMKPGRPYADLIAIWQQTARRGRCQAGRTIGHGLGLGQDGPLLDPGQCDGVLMEEGDCIVLKPWTANLEDTMSVRVGGTVVVGANGARRIGSCDIRPMVVT